MKETHNHTFVISRVLTIKDKVTGIDLDCAGCKMRMFASGDFSWHRGFGQMPLMVKDTGEKK